MTTNTFIPDHEFPFGAMLARVPEDQRQMLYDFTIRGIVRILDAFRSGDITISENPAEHLETTDKIIVREFDNLFPGEYSDYLHSVLYFSLSVAVLGCHNIIKYYGASVEIAATLRDYPDFVYSEIISIIEKADPESSDNLNATYKGKIPPIPDPFPDDCKIAGATYLKNGIADGSIKDLDDDAARTLAKAITERRVELLRKMSALN